MDTQNKSNVTGKQYFIANPYWAKGIFLEENEMENYSQTIDSLPENVKDLLYSVDAAEVLDVIGKKYNLNSWQVNRLAKSAGEIISAQMPIAQFIPSIAQELEITAESARAIAQEINVKIFSKAALQIKRLQEAKFSTNGQNNIQNRNKETERQRDNFSQSIPPQTRRPEERIVNLQKRVDETPKFVEPGPKIEGNIIDLSN